MNLEDLLEKSDDKILEYIKSNFDIYSEDQFGKNFLELLIKDSRIDLIKKIHEKGHDILKKSKFGSIEIIYDAALWGQNELIKYLHSIGLDIDGDSPDGFTPLMTAARSRHDSTVNLLINIGAQVNLQSERGMTALHFATEANSLKITEALVKAGGDPTAKNKYGTMPLHYAINLSDSDMDFNRNLGEKFLEIFSDFSAEIEMLKKQMGMEKNEEERLKKRYIDVLKRIEGPILYERGSMVGSWGECTIISDEGVSYEPGGDTQVLLGPFVFSEKQFDLIQIALAKDTAEDEIPDDCDYDDWIKAISMVKAKCQPNIQYYKLSLYGDWGESEYYESVEDAENEFLFGILERSGRPNFEKWEEMSIDELKNWCKELNLI